MTKQFYIFIHGKKKNAWAKSGKIHSKLVIPTPAGNVKVEASRPLREQV